MNDEEAFEAILKEAKVTNKKIKQYMKDSGTYDNPVDIDIIKTLKSMFYEKCIEILKRRK